MRCVLFSENNEKIVTVLDTYSDTYLVSWIVCFYDQDRVANKPQYFLYMHTISK